MTKPELLKKLREMVAVSHMDPERAHACADDALLEYIDDVDVKRLFDRIERWYA